MSIQIFSLIKIFSLIMERHSLHVTRAIYDCLFVLFCFFILKTKNIVKLLAKMCAYI